MAERRKAKDMVDEGEDLMAGREDRAIEKAIQECTKGEKVFLRSWSFEDSFWPLSF